MTVLAILVVSLATKAFASADYFLEFKDEKSGKVTKVRLADDGSFESPALSAGTYVCSWSFGASNPSSVGSSGGMSSGRAIGTYSDGTIRPVVSPTTVVLTYSVQTAREASSGMATGRRQYAPLTIRKQYDKSSPQLYNFEKITVDNGDKISGKLELQDATGKACSMASCDPKNAGYDLKSATK